LPASILWLCCVLTGSGADVSGLLRDNLGNGLADVPVTTRVPYDIGTTQGVAVTDGDGRFDVSGEEGYWQFEVDNVELNARGFLGISSPGSLSVTGALNVRLTTRRLDFTHLLTGHVIDEAGQPVAGLEVQAWINENNGLFATNVATASDGSFQLGLFPALWRLGATNAPVTHVLGEQEIEVTDAPLEQQGTLAAPAVTSTIAVTVSNLYSLDIAVWTERMGTVYRLVQNAQNWFSTNVLEFPVFDGMWTIEVTNSNPRSSYPSLAVPEPVTLTVTNQTAVAAMFGATVSSSPTTYFQEIYLVTASGLPVTNASLSAFAISGNGGGGSIRPLPTPGGDPEPAGLRLPQGRWRLVATTASFPEFDGWGVTLPITIVSNITPPAVTLVFPDDSGSPRLFGTVIVDGGGGLPGHYISLRLNSEGTNYTRNLLTDQAGAYDVSVLAGHWVLGTSPPNSLGQVSSLAQVSDQDVQVDFLLLQPMRGDPLPVTVNLRDEDGQTLPGEGFALRSGLDTIPLEEASATAMVPPGLWSFSSLLFLIGSGTPSYTVTPSTRWQIDSETQSDLDVSVDRTTARIMGHIRDPEGQLINRGYASAWASLDGRYVQVNGQVSSGCFSLNVTPGLWQVAVSLGNGYPSFGGNAAVPGAPAGALAPPPPTNAWITSSAQWISVTSEVARCAFTATNVLLPDPAVLTIHLTQEGADAMPDVTGIASGPLWSRSFVTDETGLATVWLPPGPTQLSVYAAYGAYTPEALLYPTLSMELAGSSNHVEVLLRQPTHSLCGWVTNAPSRGLHPTIRASMTDAGTNYFVTGYSDAAGSFCLPVVPGVWTVWVDDDGVNPYGLQSVERKTVEVSPGQSQATVGIDLIPFEGDFRETYWAPPVPGADGTVALELRGPAGTFWRMDRTQDFLDWVPAGTGNLINRRAAFHDPAPPPAGPVFYRAVWSR